MPENVAMADAACHEACLERQVAEIIALESVFPEEGAVRLEPIERSALEMAQQAIDGGRIHSTKDQQPLSGAVRMPSAELEGQPVYLRFTLPPFYPQDVPNLQVDCSAGRAYHDRLTACVKSTAEENAGEEVLLLAVDALSQALQGLPQHSAPEQQSSSTPQQHSSVNDVLLGRKLIWFHHILSTTKRKAIVNWSAELAIGGYSKPGYPGVLIVEGAEDDLQDYVSRLRAMRWQAMEVRCEETEACDSLESLDSKRKFETRKVRELSPDGGMSELSKLCEGAGLQHMFLTAMKL